MITIKKQVSITIDGDDYDTLVRMVDFASIYITDKDPRGESPHLCGYSQRQVQLVRDLMHSIRDEHAP